MDAAALGRAETERPSYSHARQAEDVISSDAVIARALSAFEAVDGLWREWNALVPFASEPNAFAERWFVRPGLANLDADVDVRMLEVRDGATLIGLLPLGESARYGRAKVRHLRNWQPARGVLGTPLMRAGDEQTFWMAVLGALDRAEWAHSFLHIDALVEDGPVHRGLIAAAAAKGRPCASVNRRERALLQSDLGPKAYYDHIVAQEARDALKRCLAGLGELGQVSTSRLERKEQLAPWCDAFLTLQRPGSKDRHGPAFTAARGGEASLRTVIAGAFDQDRLDMLRLDLDGRPLAMLVNFLAAPGAFAFALAVDEAFARFSPAALIQLENLRILDRADIAWMDGCPVADDPAVAAFWGQRRSIVDVTVPMSGLRRRSLFRYCRTVERFFSA